MSHDHTTTLHTPAWVEEQNPVSKELKKKRKEKENLSRKDKNTREDSAETEAVSKW